MTNRGSSPFLPDKTRIRSRCDIFEEMFMTTSPNKSRFLLGLNGRSALSFWYKAWMLVATSVSFSLQESLQIAYTVSHSENQHFTWGNFRWTRRREGSFVANGDFYPNEVISGDLCRESRFSTTLARRLTNRTLGKPSPPQFVWPLRGVS
jgi:hypothetical protein